MKVSDYIADFLRKKGVKHVFVVAGGACLHLIHSFHNTEGIDIFCNLHEQASAMCADAYSRIHGTIGVAIVTSGPGATNLLTGVAGAYYDSVPSIYITGQVSTFRNKGNMGIRQLGFQETEIVEIFKPVTKYAVYINDPYRIRFELEKCFFLAYHGRPGPVIIDIPDNIQREEIDPDSLETFSQDINYPQHIENEIIIASLNLIFKSKRPIIVCGWGIHLSKCEDECRKFINTLGVPFCPTWAIADLFPTEHPLYVGTFGTHGTRYGNYAIQNADLIISLGSRLDTKATGSPVTTFARGAKKIVVEIDQNEVNKFVIEGLRIDLPIVGDVKEFLVKINTILNKKKNFIPLKIEPWLRKITAWKNAYPIILAEYFDDNKINPYIFFKKLSEECSEGDYFVLDTGCTLAWFMQAFSFKYNQRIFHDWNNTAMGWAVPASISAKLASERNIICICGDGSLLMNIQELATIIHHNLAVKIFLIDNQGYCMIRQTQDQWLNSEYIASSEKYGLPHLDLLQIASSFGFITYEISDVNEVSPTICDVLNENRPVFCVLKVDPSYRVNPQVKHGRPNEDQSPLLNREEFFSNMIIHPMEICYDLE